MAARHRHHRRSRRRPGPALAGTLLAVGIAWGGYALFTEDPPVGVDLDREERREAARGNTDTGTLPGNTTDGVPAAFPVDPPFVPEGTRLEYTIMANGPQAAAYGLDPSRARSWGFLAEDGDVTREDLLETIVEAGGTPGERVSGAPESEFTNVVAAWRGFVLVVTVHAGRTVTLSLVDVR